MTQRAGFGMLVVTLFWGMGGLVDRGSANAQEFLRGDVNNDGFLSTSDFVMLNRRRRAMG